MKVLKITPPKNPHRFPNVARWATVGVNRCYFRSKMEHRYAKYLQFRMTNKEILKWEFEPQTFWFEEIKRGVRSYKPDFKIYYAMIQPGESVEVDHYWVEVKGYMDSKSMTKIKRFRKYYPSETLHVVDAKWFTRNNKKLKMIIKDWE